MFRCSHWHCGIFHSPFVMFDEYRLRIISCKCRSIGTRWKQKRIRGKGNGNLREWKRPRIRLCRMYRDRERQMPIILRFIYRIDFIYPVDIFHHPQIWNMIKKFLTLHVCLLLLISCSDKSDRLVKVNTVKVELKRDDGSSKINEFLEFSHFVPLQTGNDI